MAKEPLFFHVRNTKKDGNLGGGATFSVQKFDDKNFSVGYAVSHQNDNFCKKAGCKIALERSTHILEHVEENAKRQVSSDKMLLPHIVRKHIDNVVKRSAELLKVQEENVCVVTWADKRLKGGLLQLEVKVK